ncbi:MAG TPA: hypothetical protein EYN06_06620 [Myxococcales bacterium]|nr:hypothetical protein [Myxococcales bacterium]
MIREFKRFQLEATKLGRNVVFQITVFEKTERNRTKLFAETQCSDPLHFIIQFIIRDATSFDNLIEKFVQQLTHRGFSPVQYRIRDDGKWQIWIPIKVVYSSKTGSAKA